MPDKPIVLSKHAQDMLDEWKIEPQWIEQVLRNPVFEEPDARHIGAVRAYAPIVAFGDYTIFRSPRGGKGSDAMRMRMDTGADALYIRFDEAEIVESEEVTDGVILDFDANGRVVGLEMLYVRERFPDTDLSRVDVEMA